MRFNTTQKNWIAVIAIVGTMTYGTCGCSPKSKIDKHIDSIAIDSLGNDTITNKYSADALYFEKARELSLTKDSLDILRDSLDNITLRYVKLVKTKDSINRINISNKEKLGVAEYKLLRIREYNRIAAQGNNLKFLRGWIKRVID